MESADGKMIDDHHVVVLGAGFSVPLGGPTSKELSARLMNFKHGLQEPERIALIQCDDYEAALNELRGSGEEDAHKRLLAAVRDEFENVDAHMRRVIQIKDGFVRHIAIFLKNLINAQELSGKRFSIVTTNQDLSIERIWSKRLDFGVSVKANTSGGEMELSGIGPIDQSSYHPENTAPIVQVGREEIGALPPEETLAYYKMHGSFNWQTKNGEPVLVTGDGKPEQCNRIEVLRTILEDLGRLFSAEGLRIMSIGYSFRDEHLNKLIKESLDHGGLLTVVDPGVKEICERLLKCGWSAKAMEYFPVATERVFSHLYGSGAYRETGASWAGQAIDAWRK